MNQCSLVVLQHEPVVRVKNLRVILIEPKCLIFRKGVIHGKTSPPHTGCVGWCVHLVLFFTDGCIYLDPIWNNDVHAQKWQSFTTCQIYLAYECCYSNPTPPPSHARRLSFGINHMPFCISGRHRKGISMKPFLMLF